MRHLAIATDTHYAFVAEFLGGERVRTLAYWAGGQIVPSVEWDLPGTPCEEVVRGTLCHHASGIKDKFPLDRPLVEMGIESYLGVPLRDVSGAVLDHLAVFDEGPMPAAPHKLATFCGSGSWDGGCLSMAPYVRRMGPTDGATTPPEGVRVDYPPDVRSIMDALSRVSIVRGAPRNQLARQRGVAMKRSRGVLVFVLPLALVFGSVATASAIILLVVVELLTLFALVGLSFTFYADVRAVPTVAADGAACDIVISVLDQRGDTQDTRQARVASGEMVTLRYLSRAEPGSTEAIRATIRSRTVPRSPLPPGPCPILASMQVVDGTTGRTEAIMLPAAQEVVRETIPAP